MYIYNSNMKLYYHPSCSAMSVSFHCSQELKCHDNSTKRDSCCFPFLHNNYHMEQQNITANIYLKFYNISRIGCQTNSNILF